MHLLVRFCSLPHKRQMKYDKLRPTVHFFELQHYIWDNPPRSLCSSALTITLAKERNIFWHSKSNNADNTKTMKMRTNMDTQFVRTQNMMFNSFTTFGMVSKMSSIYANIHEQFHISYWKLWKFVNSISNEYALYQVFN